RQLLVPVRRVVDGVEVEGQGGRRLGERGDELVDEDVPEPFEGGNGDGVLEAGQGGLTGQVRPVRGAVGDELEDRIVPQAVVVILILVGGEDAVDAGPDHL